MQSLSLHQFSDKGRNYWQRDEKRIEISRLFVNRSETQNLTGKLEMKTVYTKDTDVYKASLWNLVFEINIYLYTSSHRVRIAIHWLPMAKLIRCEADHSPSHSDEVKHGGAMLLVSYFPWWHGAYLSTAANLPLHYISFSCLMKYKIKEETCIEKGEWMNKEESDKETIK